jgi:co-chaperonin GroES (HSP10)
MTLKPSPGYLICKPHQIQTKTGAYELPPQNDDPDKAPEFGEVLEVGPLLPDKKMPYDAKYIPKVGDKIAYKKYNYFTLNIGVKQYVAVHFENVLFIIGGGINE